MDMIDLKIIQMLTKNSRITSSDISKKIHLSVPAVTERIRKLEEEKVIKKYTLLLNRKKFKLNLMAFVLVRLDKSEDVPHFQETILGCDWVLECHHITGEYNYLLKVLVEDMDKFEVFLTHFLKKITGVGLTNTMVVLSTTKEEYN